MTIAFHTLGCKVNQYDTQAMLERFRDRGYTVVPFGTRADIYLINTCTVTGTGDRKSLQLARHLKALYPGCELILCGCLAQRLGKDLLSTGARLILGTQHRASVVDLFEDALRSGTQQVAVDQLENGVPFEPLSVTSQEEHTRATLKIQEGCSGRCAYCVIPSVRGPVRSRNASEIVHEVCTLTAHGYREIVLTGIHLSSYGLDLSDIRLIDLLEMIARLPDVHRLRLGSLEPTIATPDFARRLAALPCICPQFHLALQSGSDTVLHRMRRRYNLAMYRDAVRNLRDVFPDCAITTDVLTGFPGETEAEFQETMAFLSEIGFARIHVFPFSPRTGTPAAQMPGQLSRAEKARRARLLIAEGEKTREAFQRRFYGRTAQVLVESEKDGQYFGYTPEYLYVALSGNKAYETGSEVTVILGPGNGNTLSGAPVA